MPALWTFRYYVEPDGTSDVRATHDTGTAQLRARFLSRLKILSGLPLAEWNENYWKPLHGECAGLEEIRFKSDGVQQRPIGFRSGANEFTILFWATEKGNKFVPKSACTKAHERKHIVLASRNRTNALWLVFE